MCKKEKIYVVSEMYADYKHNDSTVYSAYTTFKKAKNALDRILRNRYDYMSKNSIQEKYRSDSYSEIIWEYDDGDSLTKFYIDELEVE